jgi:ankyrin repeat protein
MYGRGAFSVRTCEFIFAFLLSGALVQAAPPDEVTQALLDSFRYDSTGSVPVVDLDAAKRALDVGANPNYIDNSKRRGSVLDHVSIFCVHDASDNPELSAHLLEALRMLFDRGARLQHVDGGILFFPIVGGHTEIVRLFLDQGASPTFWPPELGTPFTPIEQATEEGYQDIVELLVKRGAELLPPKQAVQLRFIKVAGQGNIDESENLLSEGAQVNGLNRAGETALLSAIGGFSGRRYEGYLTVVYLLDKGADLNLKGKGRFGVTTPLHDLVWLASIVEGQPDRWVYAQQLLRVFIQGGAFVSGVDEDEKTPLHIAAENNGVEAARILLRSGAKVMPRDRSKKTPLDYAQSAEMIALLKEYGAKEQ